jgi:ubiquinol-cytochrome c reductase iron-sulfur subunit
LTDCDAQVIIKWRGKPVFIRHRTADEIKDAENTKWENLRDPQPDSDRVKKPEWLIMVGMFDFCLKLEERYEFSQSLTDGCLSM